MPEFKALSRNVLKFRHEHGENQLEFAEHCDVSHFTISAIENVANNAELTTIQKIASYMGMTVSELLAVEKDN